MEKIGLLAGVGRLPVEFARAARGMGFDVVAVALLPDVDAELEQTAAECHHIGVGQLERLIAVLRRSGVTKATVLGKVTKELLFNGGAAGADERMKKLLYSLPDHSDDTLMRAFVRVLAAEGIGVFDQTALIRSLMPAAGVLTKRPPTDGETADMRFGFQIAKAIGGLDIGQTVVVKQRAVLAVEAIEGTDACILRGGQLGRGGVTVVKTAKPAQDARFDVPTVGVATLESMIRAGATALAIEAGETLLVEKEKALALAAEKGITIVAM